MLCNICSSDDEEVIKRRKEARLVAELMEADKKKARHKARHRRHKAKKHKHRK